MAPVALHVVCDNYATHKHPKVQAWLARNLRIQLHFTPTSASWLNLVEVFFSIISRQAIRRGSFDSVADLIAAIRTFIDAWNQRCEPFVWTKAHRCSTRSLQAKRDFDYGTPVRGYAPQTPEARTRG